MTANYNDKTHVAIRIPLMHEREAVLIIPKDCKKEDLLIIKQFINNLYEKAQPK